MRAPGVLISSENNHRLSGCLPFLGLPLSPAAHLGRLAPSEVGMCGRYRLMGAGRAALLPLPCRAGPCQARRLQQLGLACHSCPDLAGHQGSRLRCCGLTTGPRCPARSWACQCRLARTRKCLQADAHIFALLVPVLLTLAARGPHCCVQACSRCSVQASHRGASLIPEQRLQAHKASGAVVPGLGCSAACRIFPDQGSNLCPPCIGRQILNHWTATEVCAHIFI